MLTLESYLLDGWSKLGYLGGKCLVSRLFCYLFYVFKDSENNKELLSNLGSRWGFPIFSFSFIANTNHRGKKKTVQYV